MRVLPDPEICLVRHRFGELWECQVDYSQNCPYSITFGYTCYCRHPNREGCVRIKA